MEISRFAFPIGAGDADAFGSVTAARLLGCLLESAGGSADHLGFGIRELQQRGYTWVLGRICLVTDDSICAGDDIEIETWPSGIERAVALRDFRIYRQGRELGRATSVWFVLDMQTRMPVRPHTLLPAHLHAQTEHVLALARSIAALTEPATLQRKFEVQVTDIDLNHHVTATTYIGWAMGAVPEELARHCWLQSMDIQFLEECHLGSRISSEAQLQDPHTLLHRVLREDDGRELARLTTTWVPR